MSEAESKGDQQQKPPSLFNNLIGESQDSISSNQKPTTSLFSSPSLFQTGGLSQLQQSSLLQSSQQKYQPSLPLNPQKQSFNLGFANQSQKSEKEKEEQKQRFEFSWFPRKPTPNDKEIATYKVVLVGDTGVGKSCWVQRYLSLGFQRQDKSPLGVEIVQLNLMTNYGHVQFNIWDCSGQEKLGSFSTHYLNADCAIIMFDVTSRVTHKNVPKWYKDVFRICRNIPIVVVGNKVDLNDKKVVAKSVIFNQIKSMQYCELSAKSGYQYEKPLLLLLRMLKYNNKIELLSGPVPQPEEARLTDEEMQQVIEYEGAGEDAPLPENNEDKEFSSNEVIVED